MPLDEIDFEERPGIAGSGWPFQKDHLDPFYARAIGLCDVGPYDYEVAPWEKSAGPHLPVSEKVIVPSVMRRNPVRFGKVYRDSIDKLKNVKVYLHANATRIIQDQNTEEVTGVKVKTLSGLNLKVNSRFTILATGGIENARLLLNSNEISEFGIGNDNDLVGRYFMEHPMVPASMLVRPCVSPWVVRRRETGRCAPTSSALRSSSPT